MYQRSRNIEFLSEVWCINYKRTPEFEMKCSLSLEERSSKKKKKKQDTDRDDTVGGDREESDNFSYLLISKSKEGVYTQCKKLQ